MKTLTTLTAALLITLSFSAFAIDDAKKNNRSSKMVMDYTINTYINAVSYGDTKDLAEVLDPNAKYVIATGKNVRNYSKSELIKSLKTFENVHQNCETTYSVIESDPSQVVVKVIMKYDLFSKTNVITMAKTDRGWKITNISASFN